MSQAPTPSETPLTDALYGEVIVKSGVPSLNSPYHKLVTHARRLERDRARLIESVKYCELSTRADGQWADQAVNSFLLALIKELTC